METRNIGWNAKEIRDFEQGGARMRLVERNVNECFVWDEHHPDTEIGKYVVSSEVYYYNSEEEREQHKEVMISDGWEDSGQIKKTIGSLLDENPKWTWYGRYNKKHVILKEKTKKARFHKIEY